MNCVTATVITITSTQIVLKVMTGVGAAVVHRNKTKCVRLPYTPSIFRAELFALLLAIDVVGRSKEKNGI